MNITGGQPLKTEDIPFADLKRSKRCMRVLGEDSNGSTGAYTRELTDQEASKLWKVLTHVLENLYVSTIQETKELQSKT